MKSLTFLLFAVLLLSLSSAFIPHPSSLIPHPPKGEVTFTCNVNACDKVDSIYLFEFNGITFRKLKSAPTTDWQTYQFKLPATGARFYYVGLANTNLKPLILGSEEEVTLQGSCPSFQGAQLPNSAINNDYEQLKNAMNQHKSELGNLLQQFQAANSQENVEQANAVIGRLGKLDKKRLALLDSLKKVNPYLAKIAALNTYVSYQNYGTGDENEIEYFGNKYFQYVDWKDPAYNYNAWVYEGLKGYAQTITAVGLPEVAQREFLDKVLQKIPAGSHAHKLALGGVISAMQGKTNGNMGIYVKQYLEKYKSTEPEAAAQLEQMLRQSGGITPGGEAPDFTMNTPEDKPMSLKDLRGKVVLVDFWASWCGPCRRENPHVVEAYNHYHAKGFDVLGVSLDKDKPRWLDAIAKDGLIWHHVSDLKGWQNSAAQLYGVTSIPHTVLVDKDGKIIARNLRGDALTAKLKELFGE